MANGLSTLLLLTTAIFGIFAKEPTSELCNEPHARCRMTGLLEAIAEMPTLLPDEDFLNKYCDQVHYSLGCYGDLVEKCFPDQENAKVMEMTQAQNVVYRVCDRNDSLSKIYLKYVNCANQQTPEFQNRQKLMERLSTRFKQHLQTSLEDEQKYHAYAKCIDMELAIKSLTDVLGEYCGDEAKAGGLEILEPLKWACTQVDIDELKSIYSQFLFPTREEMNTVGAVIKVLP